MSEPVLETREELEAHRMLLLKRVDELEFVNYRLRVRVKNQKRELSRLNKYLGPYWAGFSKGLSYEGEIRLRRIMNATFGHEKVRAAEIEAIPKDIDALMEEK